MLQDFRTVLDDISSVCNMTWQKDRLEQSDQLVRGMQRTIHQQLELFLQAARVNACSIRFYYLGEKPHWQ